MIECYVGLIGGGKTFNAEGRMAEYIASGGVVCTNVQQMIEPWYNYRYAKKLKKWKLDEKTEFCHVDVDASGVETYWANAHGLRHFLLSRYGWELQEGQIRVLCNEMIEGDLHEFLPKGTIAKPVLVVIDEAVDFFDMEERKDANKAFLTFLRYSRKLNIDIIMIAQEFTELNKRIRNQVQWVWTFKDLGTERVPILRVKFPYPYNQNICCAQWSGRRFGSGTEEPVRIKMRFKDQGVFGCYQTEELFREVNVLKNVKTDFTGEGKQIRINKMNKVERGILIVACVFSILGFFFRSHSDNDKEPVLDNSSGVVNDSSKSKLLNQEPVRVIYGKFSYSLAGGREVLRVDGVEYHVGDLTPYGSVLAVDSKQIHIMNDAGSHLFIYRSYDKSDNSPDSESVIDDTYVRVDTALPVSPSA